MKKDKKSIDAGSPPWTAGSKAPEATWYGCGTPKPDKIPGIPEVVSYPLPPQPFPWPGPAVQKVEDQRPTGVWRMLIVELCREAVLGSTTRARITDLAHRILAMLGEK